MRSIYRIDAGKGALRIQGINSRLDTI